MKCGNFICKNHELSFIKSGYCADILRKDYSVDIFIRNCKDRKRYDSKVAPVLRLFTTGMFEHISGTKLYEAVKRLCTERSKYHGRE